MVTKIIPRDTGGILHLPRALEMYPRRGVCVLHRVSEWGAQTGGAGAPKLVAKAYEIFDQVRSLIEGKASVVHRPFYAVERGKLSAPRPSLIAAARYAASRNCILVAADCSRFIKSEAYCRHTSEGRSAWPTPDEFKRLRDLTFGVPLATVLPPDATERERLSAAIKRRGCGRPAIPPAKKLYALGLLGTNRNGEWEMSVSRAAKLAGFSRAAFSDFLKSEVPPELVNNQVNIAWEKLPCPYATYLLAKRESAD